ncbi:PilZ domain-containing protein [Novosphingobium sp. TH158]|uniref:PilZ domain-containing protein n=1 Tax=Novosphingobium sp. TH158 TaxID=2067455 RepID=UPI000C7C83B6|nr:PilZ domain-containing protein [Novosphingobium sp. TH158]PLK27677.1 PilZ domain-containing protein [Novosphingobium sp. TH158]
MAETLAFLRRSRRFVLAMPARLRLPGGPGEPVLVTDLSEHGCRIECWGMALAEGDRVILRPQGLEPLYATIRWIKGARLGLVFSRPLYGPVIEHLARCHPPYDAASERRLVA